MYLDISNLFLFCLISLVVGAVVMLIAQVQSSRLLFSAPFVINNNVFFLFLVLHLSAVLQAQQRRGRRAGSRTRRQSTQVQSAGSA
jgi:hypothetical protein